MNMIRTVKKRVRLKGKNYWQGKHLVLWMGLIFSTTLCCLGCLSTIAATSAPAAVSSASSRNAPTMNSRRKLQNTLTALLAEIVKTHDEVPAAAVHVEAPKMKFSFSTAAGMAHPEQSQAMTPHHPVRIASVTKTFVAAAVLRAWEDELLLLDDSIAQYLPVTFVRILEQDGYDPEQMTIRHLLTHTSGLFDHSDSKQYTKSILDNPNHQWTREEQLTYCVKWGKPWGMPGDVYVYSDTGYVLLGAILETVAEKSLGRAVRDLLDFQRLGLRSTWWEVLEQPPVASLERAHQFYGALDTAEFEPYYDLYGGGGLVATVEDLALFYRGIFTEGVFQGSSTSNIMLSTVDGAVLPTQGDNELLPPGAYRMGIWVEKLEGSLAYSHTGFFGVTVSYFPQEDMSIAVTVNQSQAKAALETLLRRAFVLVRDVQQGLQQEWSEM